MYAYSVDHMNSFDVIFDDTWVPGNMDPLLYCDVVDKFDSVKKIVSVKMPIAQREYIVQKGFKVYHQYLHSELRGVRGLVSQSNDKICFEAGVCDCELCYMMVSSADRMSLALPLVLATMARVTGYLCSAFKKVNRFHLLELASVGFYRGVDVSKFTAFLGRLLDYDKAERKARKYYALVTKIHNDNLVKPILPVFKIDSVKKKILIDTQNIIKVQHSAEGEEVDIVGDEGIVVGVLEAVYVGEKKTRKIVKLSGEKHQDCFDIISLLPSDYSAMVDVLVESGKKNVLIYKNREKKNGKRKQKKNCDNVLRLKGCVLDIDLEYVYPFDINKISFSNYPNMIFPDNVDVFFVRSYKNMCHKSPIFDVIHFVLAYDITIVNWIKSTCSYMFRYFPKSSSKLKLYGRARTYRVNRSLWLN